MAPLRRLIEPAEQLRDCDAEVNSSGGERFDDCAHGRVRIPSDEPTAESLTWRNHARSDIRGQLGTSDGRRPHRVRRAGFSPLLTQRSGHADA